MAIARSGAYTLDLTQGGDTVAEGFSDLDNDFDYVISAINTQLLNKDVYNANTILAADTDDTPAALTIAEQRVVGRMTGGNIDGLTAAQLNTLLITNSIKSSTITVTVGSGGDYSNLQDAINGLLKYKPAQGGSEVFGTINILTGTTITAGVKLFNVDCNWMKITAADATVTATVAAELFKGYSSKFPQIAVKFDMGDAGTNGIAAYNGSFIKVAASCGVINAGLSGIYLENSRAEIDGALFTSCGNNGIDIRYGSSASARGADVSSTTKYGLNVTYGSMCDAYQIDASGSERGIDVSAGSNVCVISADASGCTGYGVHVTSSICDFSSGDASGCTGTNGIYSAYGALVNAVDANAQMGGSPSTTDFVVAFGGILSAQGTSATGGVSNTANAITHTGIIFNGTTDWAILEKAGGTMTGELNMADNELTRPKLKDVSEKLLVIGNMGATQTFDMEVANVFTATNSEACVATLDNAYGTTANVSFTVFLTNGGAFTIDWTNVASYNVIWPGGVAPDLTNSGLDALVFTTNDGGSNWYGFVAGMDIK